MISISMRLLIISSVVVDDIEEVYLQNLKIKIQVLRFCNVAVSPS